jgi:hypothetical protein
VTDTPDTDTHISIPHATLVDLHDIYESQSNATLVESLRVLIATDTFVFAVSLGRT